MRHVQDWTQIAYAYGRIYKVSVNISVTMTENKYHSKFYSICFNFCSILRNPRLRAF